MQKLLEMGVAGAMLYWFAVRLEKRNARLDEQAEERNRRMGERLENLEISLDRSARASALLIVALSVSKAITDQALTVMDDIDAKRRTEGKR